MLKLWRLHGGKRGVVYTWISVHISSHLSFLCWCYYRFLKVWQGSHFWIQLENLSKVWRCADTAAADLKHLTSPWFIWALTRDKTENTCAWINVGGSGLENREKLGPAAKIWSRKEKWRSDTTPPPQITTIQVTLSMALNLQLHEYRSGQKPTVEDCGCTVLLPDVNVWCKCEAGWCCKRV